MSSGENDPGAGKGSSGGPPLVAKGGIRSERQGLVVIGFLAVVTISGLVFGGKLFWNVQQRQYAPDTFVSLKFFRKLVFGTCGPRHISRYSWW